MRKLTNYHVNTPKLAECANSVGYLDDHANKKAATQYLTGEHHSIKASFMYQQYIKNKQECKNLLKKERARERKIERVGQGWGREGMIERETSKKAYESLQFD